jgi:hypothetical protein
MCHVVAFEAGEGFDEIFPGRIKTARRIVNISWEGGNRIGCVEFVISCCLLDSSWTCGAVGKGDFFIRKGSKVQHAWGKLHTDIYLVLQPRNLFHSYFIKGTVTIRLIFVVVVETAPSCGVIENVLSQRTPADSVSQGAARKNRRRGHRGVERIVRYSNVFSRHYEWVMSSVQLLDRRESL